MATGAGFPDDEAGGVGDLEGSAFEVVVELDDVGDVGDDELAADGAADDEGVEVADLGSVGDVDTDGVVSRPLPVGSVDAAAAEAAAEVFRRSVGGAPVGLADDELAPMRPRGADEVVCASCFLIVHATRVADPAGPFCRDCA
jgi:hypothetical protein